MTPEEMEREFGILRDMTRRTGILAEPQLKQLRLWPSAILNRKCEAIFSNEDRALLYELDGSGLPGEMEMGYLAVCTKWLLGQDVRVGVRANNDSWVSNEAPTANAGGKSDSGGVGAGAKA